MTHKIINNYFNSFELSFEIFYILKINYGFKVFQFILIYLKVNNNYSQMTLMK